MSLEALLAGKTHLRTTVYVLVVRRFYPNLRRSFSPSLKARLIDCNSRTFEVFGGARTDLAAVAGHPDVVPVVVVELPAGRLHQGLERSGTEIDDQPQSSVPQGQVDVVGRPSRVEQQAVPLQGAEGQRDLIHAALNRGLGKVVAEELAAPEGGRRLLLACEETGNISVSVSLLHGGNSDFHHFTDAQWTQIIGWNNNENNSS